MGCVAGDALYSFSPELPFGATKLSVSPPTKALQLLAYQDPQLFIKAANGLTYSCDTVKNSCVLGSVPNPLSQRPFWGQPNPQTLFLLGTVVDSLVTRICEPDGYVEVCFVVLDDGTIWWWSGVKSAYDFFGVLPLLCLAGGLVGATIGLIILWMKPWRIGKAIEPN